MTKLEALIIAKAIRDTPMSNINRGNLVKKIVAMMKQRDPLFPEKPFRETVVNADYKDHQVNYLLEQLDGN